MPDEVVDVLLRNDDDPLKRQFGIVAADGSSATYTGDDCVPWAGGRSGPGYAVQGNILTVNLIVIVAVNEVGPLDIEGMILSVPSEMRHHAKEENSRPNSFFSQSCTLSW